MPANIGYHAATWVVTLAISIGFAEVSENYPFFFQYVSYAGTGCIFYLAWIF
jgi:threonine/homoserine/homoserine lactone efflux protein